jgi:hypothetical protein
LAASSFRLLHEVHGSIAASQYLGGSGYLILTRDAPISASRSDLVQNDENTKVLAPNLSSSNGDDDWDQASGLFTIPTAAVTKMERLISASEEASEKICGLAAA